MIQRRRPGRRAVCAAVFAVTLAAAMAVLTGTAAAQSETLRIRADEWCPYNCAPTGDKPGFMIEIAKAILEPAGIRVNYETMPWQRALQAVASGEIDAVVGASGNDARRLVVGQRPLGQSANVLVVRKGEAFAYTGPASIGQRSVGVIRGYAYGDELDAWLQANQADTNRVQVASGETALDLNLRKLQARRVDIVVEDAQVAAGAIKAAGLDGQVELIPAGTPEPLYIALAPGKPLSTRVAGLLDEGIVALRGSGRLKAILDRYDVTDWE